MNDIVKNAIDRTCIVTGSCETKDYSKMQNCIKDLRLYNDMMTDKSYYQQVEELQELRKENQKLKGSLQTYEILLKANVEENKQLKEKLERERKIRKEALNLIKAKEFVIDLFMFGYELDDYDIFKLKNILDIDKGE